MKIKRTERQKEEEYLAYQSLQSRRRVAAGYCPEREHRARKLMAQFHAESLKFYGTDLIIYPDLLEAKNGLGVFLNPEEGKEIMEQFDEMTEGFRRQGVGLPQWQEEVIRGFIRSASISPAFVLRVINEYRDKSLKSVFRLQDTKAGYWLDYLLRRYKGHFFRKRYPAISWCDLYYDSITKSEKWQSKPNPKKFILKIVDHICQELKSSAGRTLRPTITFGPRGRRGIQVGIAMVTTNQSGMPLVTMTNAGQFM